MSRNLTPEQVNHLRNLLPVGTTIRTIVRWVSSSGMSRRLSAYVVRDGELINLDRYMIAAGIGGTPRNGADGFTIGGAGMDMGFHAVYSLSRTLYPDGFHCIGHGRGTKRGTPCPSNDHSNDWGDLARQWEREHPEPAELDALRQQYATASAAARSESSETGSPEHAAAVAEWERIGDQLRALREAQVSARADWIAEQEPTLWRRTRKHSDGGYAIRQAWM